MEINTLDTLFNFIEHNFIIDWMQPNYWEFKDNHWKLKDLTVIDNIDFMIENIIEPYQIKLVGTLKSSCVNEGLNVKDLIKLIIEKTKQPAIIEQLEQLFNTLWENQYQVLQSLSHKQIHDNGPEYSKLINFDKSQQLWNNISAHLKFIKTDLINHKFGSQRVVINNIDDYLAIYQEQLKADVKTYHEYYRENVIKVLFCNARFKDPALLKDIYLFEPKFARQIDEWINKKQFYLINKFGNAKFLPTLNLNQQLFLTLMLDHYEQYQTIKKTSKDLDRLEYDRDNLMGWCECGEYGNGDFCDDCCEAIDYWNLSDKYNLYEIEKDIHAKMDQIYEKLVKQGAQAMVNNQKAIRKSLSIFKPAQKLEKNKSAKPIKLI